MSAVCAVAGAVSRICAPENMSHMFILGISLCLIKCGNTSEAVLYDLSKGGQILNLFKGEFFHRTCKTEFCKLSPYISVIFQSSFFTKSRFKSSPDVINMTKKRF